MKAKARKRIEPRKRKVTSKKAAVVVDPEVRMQRTISSAQRAMEAIRASILAVTSQNRAVNEGLREEYRTISQAGLACTDEERGRLVKLWDYIQLTQVIAERLCSVLDGKAFRAEDRLRSEQARVLVSAWQGLGNWPDPDDSRQRMQEGDQSGRP